MCDKESSPQGCWRQKAAKYQLVIPAQISQAHASFLLKNVTSQRQIDYPQYITQKPPQEIWFQEATEGFSDALINLSGLRPKIATRLADYDNNC